MKISEDYTIGVNIETTFEESLECKVELIVECPITDKLTKDHQINNINRIFKKFVNDKKYYDEELTITFDYKIDMISNKREVINIDGNIIFKAKAEDVEYSFDKPMGSE